MDNLSKQIEEIEALSAIYGEEFQTEDEVNRKFSIKINVDQNDNHLYAILYVKFPDSYPSTSPPIFEISAPHLTQERKICLYKLLEDVYLSYVGENVIFQWIEKIREELVSLSMVSDSNLKTDLIDDDSSKNLEESEKIIKPEVCPEIIHGEVILDRKSSFQAHVATVFSVNEVRQVLSKLKENRKIQQATHNIYAYRIQNEKMNNLLHDCDDDGEIQAGSRLLHLLKIMNVKNVVVIVSRWYGGIHLGPDRFRHINNAARQVINSANLLPISKK